eukprot:3938976-Rhodomonas_salina.1
MGGEGYYDGYFATPDVRRKLVCFPMSNNLGWKVFGTAERTGSSRVSCWALLVNFARFDGDVVHIAWLCAVHGVILGVGCCVQHFRARLLKEAKAVVALDEQRYDEAWKQLREEQLDGLYRLQTLLDAKGRKKVNALPHARSRPPRSLCAGCPALLHAFAM